MTRPKSVQLVGAAIIYAMKVIITWTRCILVGRAVIASHRSVQLVGAAIIYAMKVIIKWTRCILVGRAVIASHTKNGHPFMLTYCISVGDTSQANRMVITLLYKMRLCAYDLQANF